MRTAIITLLLIFFASTGYAASGDGTQQALQIQAKKQTQNQYTKQTQTKKQTQIKLQVQTNR
jgi:hypothetical protein